MQQQQQQQPRPGASVALIVASNQQSRAAMIATSVAARRWFGLHPVTGNIYANMHMMLFYYVFVSP